MQKATIKKWNMTERSLRLGLNLVSGAPPWPSGLGRAGSFQRPPAALKAETISSRNKIEVKI